MEQFIHEVSKPGKPKVIYHEESNIGEFNAKRTLRATERAIRANEDKPILADAINCLESVGKLADAINCLESVGKMTPKTIGTDGKVCNQEIPDEIKEAVERFAKSEPHPTYDWKKHKQTINDTINYLEDIGKESTGAHKNEVDVCDCRDCDGEFNRGKREWVYGKKMQNDMKEHPERYSKLNMLTRAQINILPKTPLSVAPEKPCVCKHKIDDHFNRDGKCRVCMCDEYLPEGSKNIGIRNKSVKSFRLGHCLKCNQMTNHLYNEKTGELECQKCKTEKPDINRAMRLPKLDSKRTFSGKGFMTRHNKK